jgi:hypothetical protein
MTKTLGFDKLSGCILLVVGREAPADLEWDGYLAFLKSNLSAGSVPRLLVYTGGGAPTALQRKKLQAATEPFAKVAKIAVVTASVVARGAVTALSWFSPGHAAFSPEKMEEALAFLGVNDADRMIIKANIRTMERKVASTA